MTHLAPRQGWFATAILASFCLHLLVFVITGTSQQEKRYQEHATTLAKSLSQELELPLSIGDPVGASVIISRHRNDTAVSSIAVYGADDKLIVPLGNTEQHTPPVTANIENGKPLGKVVIIPNQVSRTAIFMEYWLYLFFVLILHILLWFFYGYIAQPSKEYEERLQEEVRKKLVANGIPLESDQDKTQPPSEEKPTFDPTSFGLTDTDDKKRTLGGLFDKLTGKTDDPENTPRTPKITLKTEYDTPAESGFSFYSTNQKTTEHLYIQLTFIDDNRLLNMLEDSAKNSYLALCNQLLDKTANKVLSRPLLAGVRLDSIQHFQEQEDGHWVACIKIGRSNNYARLALAGAMMSKLIPSINQVVYTRHRDMGMFALPIKAIASDETRKEGALLLLQKRNESSLLLLNQEDNNQLNAHFSLARHKEANTLYEKECRIITSANDDMLKQMTDLRNAILLQD